MRYMKPLDCQSADAPRNGHCTLCINAPNSFTQFKYFGQLKTTYSNNEVRDHLVFNICSIYMY